MKSVCKWCYGSGFDTSADGRRQIYCGSCGGSGFKYYEDDSLSESIRRVVFCLCQALQCPKCFRLPEGGRHRVFYECLFAVPGADHGIVLLAIDTTVADRPCQCGLV